MLIRIYSFTLCVLLTAQIDAKSGRRKGELKETLELKDWTGKWFPFDSKKLNTTMPTGKLQNDLADNAKKDWTLKWFPFDPKKSKNTTKTIGESQANFVDNSHKDRNQKWFPVDSKKSATANPKTRKHKINNSSDDIHTDWGLKWFPFKPSHKTLENSIAICDDGQHSIEIDFDPNDKRYSLNHLCLSNNRSAFSPNLTLEAILEEQFIPPAFVPPIKCLNDSINYENPLSTFGAFRPLPPKYGSYIFLPQQRWLHSIAEGAIVMLYHPCAFPGQVKLLRDTLRSCLYRHIITPSQALKPDRPLALLAWGKSLQLSVVDEKMVVDFIKSNAKLGPIPMGTKLGFNGFYEVGLEAEAKLITDIEDTEICGYKEM